MRTKPGAPGGHCCEDPPAGTRRPVAASRPAVLALIRFRKARQAEQRPPRSQKPIGVLQELYSLLLAQYAVRALMAEAATQAGLAPTRLSFVRAVEVIRSSTLYDRPSALIAAVIGSP